MEEKELLAAIKAGESRLYYADWLEERGRSIEATTQRVLQMDWQPRFDIASAEWDSVKRPEFNTSIRRLMAEEEQTLDEFLYGYFFSPYKTTRDAIIGYWEFICDKHVLRWLESFFPDGQLPDEVLWPYYDMRVIGIEDLIDRDLITKEIENEE